MCLYCLKYTFSRVFVFVLLVFFDINEARFVDITVLFYNQFDAVIKANQDQINIRALFCHINNDLR